MTQNQHESSVARRRLLQAGALGALAVASPSTVRAAEPSSPSEGSPRPGREVWIASLTLDGIEGSSREATLRNVLDRMDQVASGRPDLICLPECFPGYYKPTPTSAQQGEPLDGPTITAIAAFSRQQRCYVVAPITLERGGKLFNTAVLVGRDGKVVGTYDKIHPTEGELKAGITPGRDAPVFETDFGRLGIQICFDVEWPDGWQRLRDKGAELVVWPSAYPGGFPIRARAWMHRYLIVTSPWTAPAALIDVDGDTLAQSGRWQPWISTPICLDRALFDTDFHVQKVRKLARAHARDVSIRWCHHEDAFVLENRIPGRTLSDLAAEFGLVTMDAYLARVKAAQDHARG
jgi:predicted amidohydrolase